MLIYLVLTVDELIEKELYELGHKFEHKEGSDSYQGTGGDQTCHSECCCIKFENVRLSRAERPAQETTMPELSS
jgi:hypothetical protein